MAERDPGNAPRANDRIQYVFVRIDKNGVEDENAKQAARVEHPDYVKENNLQLDYLYYIRKQIMKPVCQFLSLIMKNPESIFNDIMNKEIHRRKGAKVTDINKFASKLTTNDIDDLEPKKTTNNLSFNEMIRNKIENKVKYEKSYITEFCTFKDKDDEDESDTEMFEDEYNKHEGEKSPKVLDSIEEEDDEGQPKQIQDISDFIDSVKIGEKGTRYFSKNKKNHNNKNSCKKSSGKHKSK
jgi:hypothetical protein